MVACCLVQGGQRGVMLADFHWEMFPKTFPFPLGNVSQNILQKNANYIQQNSREEGEYRLLTP